MIRTIIVDDEILSRIGIQSFLDGKEGIEVKGVFGSGEEALEFLQENLVDVVITDIEMSEMNGLEFIGHIREKQLAAGIIILSCHESFSYAQEAIQKGTDSYMIKHSITEESLIQEVKKVYQTTCGRARARVIAKKSLDQISELQADRVYSVCVFRWRNAEEGKEAGQTDQMMFLHLLEEIVEENPLDTVLAPRNKNIFLLLQLEKEWSEEERICRRAERLESIYSAIRTYLSEKPMLGVSSFYRDLKETKDKYEEAMHALNQGFYSANQDIFYYRQPALAEIPPLSIPSYDMLEEGWMENFEQELQTYFNEARRKNVLAYVLKTQLEHSLERILFHIMKNYGLLEQQEEIQNAFRLQPLPIHQAATAEHLRKTALSQVAYIREELGKRWNRDDLSGVFCYIEEHLREQITMEQLTDLSFMSSSTFCKKFKNRTGVTLIQYLNERRIEKAKIYLQNSRYSLEEVAELTGFASTNYLVRVFKKITKQTVSEYRKGFRSDLEGRIKS